MSEDDEVPLEEFVRRASQGDAIAQQKLYDSYARDFDGSTKYWLFQGGCWARDVHGPEISQSLWKNIFKDLSKLTSPEKFVAWAQTILKHLVLEHVAGPKGCKWAPVSIDELDKQKALPVAAIYPDHVSMDCAVLWNEICEEAEKRPKFRQILELHLLEGFTHKEISTMIDETPENVRLIYSRGLKDLHRFLGDKETMVRRGALQLRPESGDLQQNGSKPDPPQYPDSDEASVCARGSPSSQSRGDGKAKQRSLFAHQQRNERRSPNGRSGMRRTR